MVSFVCGKCEDVLTKPKLKNHMNRYVQIYVNSLATLCSNWDVSQSPSSPDMNCLLLTWYSECNMLIHWLGL